MEPFRSECPSRRFLLRLLYSAGLSVGLWSAARTGAKAQDTSTTSNKAVFRRGIGVSHYMGYADVGSDNDFLFPPFSGPGREFHTEEMQALRDAGVDFVRLAVDPGPFLAFKGVQLQWMNNRLISMIKSVANEGLGIVVDLHPSNLHPDYIPEKLTQGVDDKAFQAYLKLVTSIAKTLDQLSRQKLKPGKKNGLGQYPILALELMNEPEVDARTWQPMLEAAYKAARKGSPTLTLVLGAGQQNSVEALLSTDVKTFARDPALIYTFHDYEPWQFTHQEAARNPAFYLTDVPYPASSGSLRATIAATNERIQHSELTSREKANEQKAARRRLEAYYRTGYDKGVRDARYDRIERWAKDHRVGKNQILLGEFGVHRTAYQASGEGSRSRTRWFTEIREAAEARGFGWSAWVDIGPGGFALAERDVGPRLDPAVIHALGLKSAPKP